MAVITNNTLNSCNCGVCSSCRAVASRGVVTGSSCGCGTDLDADSVDYLSCLQASIPDCEDVASIQDIIAAAGIPPVSPVVAGNLVQQLADGTLEDAGFAPGDYYLQSEFSDDPGENATPMITNNDGGFTFGGNVSSPKLQLGGTTPATFSRELVISGSLSVASFTAGETTLPQLTFGETDIDDFRLIYNVNQRRLDFYVDDGAIRTMSLPTNGRVGIRTSSPDSILHIVSPSSSEIGQIIQGAASQSANLTEWQDDSGNTVLEVQPNGNISQNVDGDKLWTMKAAGGVPEARVYQQGTTTLFQALAGNAYLQAANGDVYILNSAGTQMRFRTNGAYIGASATPAGQLHIGNQLATRVGLVVQGFAGQTANLTEWQDSTGTNLISIEDNGLLRSTAPIITEGTLYVGTSSGATFRMQRAGANYIEANNAAGIIQIRTGGTNQSAQFDADTTAGNTRFLVYDVDNGTLERVSVGAADSGGAGYKVLRIPN